MVDIPGPRRSTLIRPAAVAAVALALLAVLAAMGSVAIGTGAQPAGAATAPATTTRSTTYRWGVVGNGGKIARLERALPTAISGISGTVVQVATSNSDGYARTSSGRVYAWGVGSSGELGNGTTVPYSTRAVRVDLPSDVHIISLANPMPFDGALAIDSTGHVWTWGLNATDDLCLGGLVHSRPAKLPLAHVSLATGARTHSLIDSNGTVYACGSGDAGKLGTGSTASVTTPTPVVGLPKGLAVKTLTSSWEGSGALMANGAYYNWGYNAAGQLGDGTTNSAVPIRVRLPGGSVSTVFQGGSGPNNGQTVALTDSHTLWTWGSNTRGQLGNGTRVSSSVPIRVDVPAGVRFTVISSGGYASYGIDTQRRLWAWGSNQDGQLGTGSGRKIVRRPVQVGIRLSQVTSTAQNVAGLAVSTTR